MESTRLPLLQVSDFLALTNQTLEYAFSSIAIEGEVTSFKVNQNKYVFFDLKDATGSVGCFMTVWQLRQPIEDGMKVVVTATPKLTDWGKFSLTVRSVRPSGEGNLKRSFELLKSKLEQEGLFRPERKRSLPKIPRHIAVISSTQAAGYADFVKILNDRWSGIKVDVAHVQVQGKESPDQIIRALNYFNSRDVLADAIVIIRGGGSMDDLAAFNDEHLVREIAKSRIPTVVGVGHETDATLSDLAADLSAATPSNAAQLLVPDKLEAVRFMRRQMEITAQKLVGKTDEEIQILFDRLEVAAGNMKRQYIAIERELEYKKNVLAELDPKKVLGRGYAIIRGVIGIGSTIDIETSNTVARAEVVYVESKK